jgi:hypothetical protein
MPPGISRKQFEHELYRAGSHAAGTAGWTDGDDLTAPTAFSEVQSEVLRVATDHFLDQPCERGWTHPANPLRHQPTHEGPGQRRFQHPAPLWWHFHQVFRDVLARGAKRVRVAVEAIGGPRDAGEQCGLGQVV